MKKLIVLLFLTGGIFFTATCSKRVPQRQLDYQNDVLLKSGSKRLVKEFLLYKDFECKAPFSCDPFTSSNLCNYTDSELSKLMKDQFGWEHKLPSVATVRVNKYEFTLRFRWNSRSALPFKKGQAWEISLALYNKEFARPYPLSTDHEPYNTPSEYITNIPCAYRDVQNYAAYMPESDFKSSVKKYCSVSDSMYDAYKLGKLNAEIGNMLQESIGQFAVGTKCPENLQANTWYYFTYKLQPGSEPASSYAWIYSSLVEDTLQIKPKGSNPPTSLQIPIIDCPYTIGNIDQSVMLGKAKYICGRGGPRRVWINRLCVPTENYTFTPGLDIQNGQDGKVAKCYDRPEPGYEEGDGDSWFDNSRYATQNLMLHGTYIGDCNNLQPSETNNTDQCGLYNIGHVASGKQCFWKGWDCYADRQYTYKHHPDNFISTFFTQSSKEGSTQASYSRVGRPSSWVHKAGNGLLQYLKFGSAGEGALLAPFGYCNGNCVFYMSGLVWQIYYHKFSYVHGALGYPKSDLTKRSYDSIQYFDNGHIRQTPNETKCVFVKIGSNSEYKVCLKSGVLKPGFYDPEPKPDPKSEPIQFSEPIISPDAGNRIIPEPSPKIPEQSPVPDLVQPPDSGYYCLAIFPKCTCNTGWNLGCWGRWSGVKYGTDWVSGAHVCVPEHIKTGKQACPGTSGGCRCTGALWKKLNSKYSGAADVMKDCSVQVKPEDPNYGWRVCFDAPFPAQANKSKRDIPTHGCLRNNSPGCFCYDGFELECWSSKWGGRSKRAVVWVYGADVCIPIHPSTGKQSCPDKEPNCLCDGAKWETLGSVYGRGADSMYCSGVVTPWTHNKGWINKCIK